MPEDPKKIHNLEILKLHDSVADQIIFSSSICDVYRYNNSSENWQQIDCKGTVFLYSRITNDEFPYAIVVINRQSPKDFHLGITPAIRSLRKGRQPMEVDLQDATIMIQESSDSVYGLWLFEESDRQKLIKLVQWCITQGTP